MPRPLATLLALPSRLKALRHGTPLLCALLVAAAATLPTQLPAQTPDGAPLMRGEPLVRALRQGGYVIYFRHAATDWSSDDHVALAGDWTSCDPERMRQLSAEGRVSARRVGAAMRALGVPVGRVHSSEYCRAAETARLLAMGPVRTTRKLMNLRADQYVGGREAAVANARDLLRTPPEPGTNTVLVAHGNLARAATGAYPGEGGAAIFRPLGIGAEPGFELVALLTAEDWSALARDFAHEG